MDPHAFLRPAIRDFLVRAGVGSGMRVMDLGCGCDETAFQAADLVGPSGEVIGLEPEVERVQDAEARAAAREEDQVYFTVGALERIPDVAAGRMFDAVVGRDAFLRRADAVDVLRRATGILAPRGIFATQELDLDAGPWSSTPLPTLDRVWGWLRALRAAGRLHGDTGPRVLRALTTLGIAEHRVIRSGAFEGPGDGPVWAWFGAFAQSFSTEARELGLDVPERVAETVAASLRREVEATGAVFVPAHGIGVAARLAD